MVRALLLYTIAVVATSVSELRSTCGGTVTIKKKKKDKRRTGLYAINIWMCINISLSISAEW